MIKKLCIFTINFPFNRQVMLDYLEKIMPRDVELFLFVPKECKGMFHSSRIKIFESEKSKYFSFFELRKFCRQNGIERIFSMGALPQEGYIMAFASALTKTDFICHLVVNPFDQYKVGLDRQSIKAFFEFLLLYPMILFTRKFYVAVKDITLMSKRHFFFVKNRIEFLTMPIDTSLFSPKNKKSLRKKLGLPLDKDILVNVGRIEYLKGSDIISRLAEKNPDKLFLLIGQLFDKKICQKNIKIIPPQGRQSLAEYYNAADLGIFPTRIDAGPLVAREAMACGTPVLVSKINGPRCINFALKSPLNVEDFNALIKKFFAMSGKERETLSKNSRDFIIKDNSGELYKHLYISKLLGNA